MKARFIYESLGSSNKTLEHLQQLVDITNGRQREYYEFLLENAKPVQIFKTSEVLSKEEIKYLPIRKFTVKQCYVNASLVCQNIQGCDYVEGYVTLMDMIPIDHAWNVKDGKYFDVTSDFVHKGKSDMSDYVSCLELNQKELLDFMIKMEIYGPYFGEYFKNHRS